VGEPFLRHALRLLHGRRVMISRRREHFPRKSSVRRHPYQNNIIAYRYHDVRVRRIMHRVEVLGFLIFHTLYNIQLMTGVMSESYI